MNRFSPNNFQKGMNKDFDERVVQPATYRDSVNFALTNEGEFFSLTKIGSSGSRMEFGVPSSRGNVISFDLLGSKECYLPNEVEAVVLFTRMETTNGTYFNIYTVDLNSNTVYNTAEGDFLNFGEVEYVDSVIDRDNGIDYVYFVDDVNEPRKISVEVGESRYTNRFQISNQRIGALDPVEDLEEEFGRGSLLGGSYQVGYKLVNTVDGTESKSSLFSNPINIVGTDKEDPTKIYGLVPNEQSSSSLVFRINLGFGYGTDEDETNKKNLYNAIQLLIIKTTDGAKVQSTIVDKLAPNKEFYTKSLNNNYIEYLGNEEASTERLEELSVDDSAIESARTITLKEGNIFYGNVRYRNLTIGENEGVASNSVTITKDIGIPSSTINRKGTGRTLEYGDKGYKKASNTCKYKSEKRGEVIRYGIAYADEYGNWSDPKPQDFSGDSALIPNPAYQTQVPSGGIQYEIERGQLKITDSTLFSLCDIGDFVNIYLRPISDPSSPFSLIPCLITDKNGTENVFVDFDDNNLREFTIEVFVDLLGSSEKNNSSTVDWKYPSRNNPKFTILNNIDNQPSISAMGLKIGSIDRHPSWAKAYAIVRVQRDKNILTQGVVLPTKAIMPSIGSGDDFEPTADANPDGSYIAKTLSKGGNANVFRVLERQSEVGQNNFSDEAASNNMEGFDQQEVSKIFKIMSPDYMASNISNDEIYDDSWLNVVKEFNVVDAISSFGTDNIGFRSSEVDTGLNAGDQQGRAFDAGDLDSQYSVRGVGGVNLNGLRDIENPITKADPNLILGRERSIVGTYPKVNSQLQTLLPSNPLKANEFFKVISTVGGMWEVGQQNEGLLESSAEQKGVYVVSDGYFGDLSYLSCFDAVQAPQRQRWFPYLDFGRRTGVDYYRVKSSTLGVGFNVLGIAESSSWNNKAENEILSSYGVLSIVELSKGLGDDRYGDINKEQNFFNTGTTGRIVSPTTPLSNIEVFGGDTFISKCYYKINSSSYGLFKKDNTSPPETGEPIALKTYFDWHEVLGVYLESDVNFDLQADKYTYPVENALNGVDFKRDYAYPYNFSYSIKNLARVWRNFALDSREQTDFGNRIVYTDKHITNSLDNSYKIVRVANFYDLDGVYGDIESLNRLTNEVYALQRNAVCYIPIGKRSIEDGSGGSLVINTTDTITTPIYLSVTNGCQDVSTVKVSKKTMSWLDRNRREVLSFSKESGIMNISDKGMYSYFQSLGENSNVWAWNDLDREEYGITIGDGYELVYSEKIGAWTSRLYTNGIRLFSAKDSIYAIDKVGTDIFLDRMYDGDGYGKILETSIEPSIEFIVNQDSIIPKVFDVIRVDSTNKFDKGRMIVNGEDNIVLDTDIHDLPIKQSRQGGYEIYTIRDVATGQRLRGKAMIVKLIDSEIFNNHISVNSVLTKYRESPNAFIKRYKK